jgi:hypothetical protein
MEKPEQSGFFCLGLKLKGKIEQFYKDLDFMIHRKF